MGKAFYIQCKCCGKEHEYDPEDIYDEPSVIECSCGYSVRMGDLRCAYSK